MFLLSFVPQFLISQICEKYLFEKLQFQYGNPDKLCGPLVQTKNNGEDLVVCSSFCHSIVFFYWGLVVVPDPIFSWSYVSLGYRYNFSLVSNVSNGEKVIFLQEAYAKYVKEYYLGSFGVDVETYNQKHLKNTAVTEGSSDRLWWFQVCTEVAYFQVAPANDSIRSSKVDTKYVSKYGF